MLRTVYLLSAQVNSLSCRGLRNLRGQVILSGMKAKNPHAVALGKLGGVKGGKARAKVLTPAQRSEIARQGGIAGSQIRWKDHIRKKTPRRIM
jgi:hypothetical protein